MITKPAGRGYRGDTHVLPLSLLEGISQAARLNTKTSNQ